LLAGIALEITGAEGSSDRPMQEIDAGGILAKVQKGQPVEYHHVIVRGDLDLSRHRLQKNITASIEITDSIFKGLVSFNSSTLEMPVYLSSSNFTRDVYFMGATFGDYVYFEGATFGGDAHFGGAVFSGDADFERAEFSGDAYFGLEEFFEDGPFVHGATFNGEADFGGAVFSGNAYFGRAEFGDDAYSGFEEYFDDPHFGGATFNGDSHFREAKFSGDANFWGAEFSDDADFGEAEFSCDADFWEAEFSGNVDFVDGWRAIGSGADFSGAEFSGNADFERATFIGNSSFNDAEFNRNIEFGNARFENETSFYRILFKKPAYFENCYIKSLNLTKGEYSRLHLRWKGIVSLHFDEAAYLALIKNYNTLGWYGDANRCYYDYRNAVRRSWQHASSPGFAAKVSSPLDRFVDFGEWILYGYGVRPSFPIAWSAMIILAFGLFFRQKRCLRKIITEEKIEDNRDGSDEVLVESKARKAPLNSIDPFLFSLFTFTSGFTAFLHPAVEYKLERCLRWAILERLLGPFLLALVITTISKTYLIR